MPFVKGKSGNPSGRPKSDAHIKQLAQERTTDALDALVHVATKGKSESAKVAAAVALLDRGWGRPMQHIDATVTNRAATEMADDELAAIAAGGSVDPTPTAPGSTVLN